MIKKEVDVVVVGGGAAGLAAAISAKRNGAKNVLIVERGEGLGGILNQCIHEGFGVYKFKEALTGPEYVQRFIDEVVKLKIPYMLDSMVLKISQDKKVLVSNKSGLYEIYAKAIILCMGCREKTRGQICIPGTRPAGVYTAGVAQNFINLRGYRVGEKIVILGSGDIGLIMARRLTLEGAKVIAVVEIMPYSSGLPRNMAQCLDDFNIPLYLRHTITEVHGKKRVEAVTIAEVDDKYKPVSRTEKKIECDTLLLSVGLIPENELSMNTGIVIDETTGGAIIDENLETTTEGVFACGNILHVHDLVDYVSLEGKKAGKSAAYYAKGLQEKHNMIKVKKGDGIRYVLPHYISTKQDVDFSLHVMVPEKNMKLVISDGDKIIKEIPKIRINPAEMIQFSLVRKELEGAKELCVKLQKIKDDE